MRGPGGGACGKLIHLDSPVLAISSVADHTHVLFDLSKNQALAQVVMEIKRGSSMWMKTQGSPFSQFRWQGAHSRLGNRVCKELQSYVVHHQPGRTPPAQNFSGGGSQFPEEVRDRV
jgi:hypothetical protein